MVEYNVITADEAKTLCGMLRDYDYEGCAGALIPTERYLWKDTTGSGKAVWVAMDNEDRNAWIEEFNTKKEAIRWLKGEE